MSSATHGTTPYYFVPGPSRHPVMAAIGLFFVILGAGQWVNGSGWGAYSVLFGLLWWLGVLYQWFRDAIAESEGGLYSDRIDASFRWSMSWFIFSEVMFFAAFFGALGRRERRGLWRLAPPLCVGDAPRGRHGRGDRGGWPECQFLRGGCSR